MYKFTSYNLIALCYKSLFGNGFSLYYSVCWLIFVGYTTLYLCPMWVNLTQLRCRRKSEPSGLSSAHSPLVELTNLQKWNCSGYGQSRLHLVFVINFDQYEGMWTCFLMSPLCQGWLWWKKRRRPWPKSCSDYRSVQVVLHLDERTGGSEMWWGHWRSSLSRRGQKVNAQPARDARSSDCSSNRWTFSAFQSNQQKNIHVF